MTEYKDLQLVEFESCRDALKESVAELSEQLSVMSLTDPASVLELSLRATTVRNDAEDLERMKPTSSRKSVPYPYHTVVKLLRDACRVAGRAEELVREAHRPAASGTPQQSTSHTSTPRRNVPEEPPSKKLRLKLPPPTLITKNCFQKVINDPWFVDKTTMLSDIVNILLKDSSDENVFIQNPVLITAPRRFGKSVNLDMCNCFFGGAVRKETFLSKNIKTDEKAMEWHGKLATIQITFGHASNAIHDLKSVIDACKQILHHSFVKYSYISSGLEELHVKEFNDWISDKYLEKTSEQVAAGVKLLVDSMYEYHGKKKCCLLLIDEFDHMCTAAMSRVQNESSLKDVITFYCGMVAEAVKHDGNCLGLFTGIARILCITRSGLNIVDYIDVLSDDFGFAKYYGVSIEEFDNLLKLPCSPKEIIKLRERAIEMYNGYKYNKLSMLNIYSVMQFYKYKKIDSYWRNSGIAIGLLKAIRNEELFRKGVNALIDDESIRLVLVKEFKAEELCSFENESFKASNQCFILNYLLQQGYLTIKEKLKLNTKNCEETTDEVVDEETTDEAVDVCIPNKEIKKEFVNAMMTYFDRIFIYNSTYTNACHD